MSLSRRSLETLIDLVEIKLSMIEVYDRDDARELGQLQKCLSELRSTAGKDPSLPGHVIAQTGTGRGRGRPRIHA